ncbi:MAG: peroxidase family protein [Planctomycetota bacterium]|nr:peroxidase family protein [Planctomycetota bacterium]
MQRNQGDHNHLRRRSQGVVLVFGMLLAACGGGGGTTPLDVVDTGPGGDGTGDGSAVVLAVQPSTVQANFNTAVTIDGAGFVAPATVEFLDEQGRVLGTARGATVENDGRRVRTESPILPGIEGTVPVRVRVRGGDGGRAEAEDMIDMTCPLAEVRSIDGSGNNTDDATIGQAGTALRADVQAEYGDGIASPNGEARDSARAISNAMCAQEASILNRRGVTDMFWLWGQFLDHDIDLTPEAEPAESFPIEIPQGDVWFDPEGTGLFTLSLHRSTWLADTGTSSANPRRQSNEITSWIDASNVYGSDAVRAAALRTNDGTGRMRLQENGLLPLNTAGLPNAPSGDIPSLFLAGDVRANEQLGLTAMHTLWVREHNRIADDLRGRNDHLTGEQLYQAARSRVSAEMQVITVREFLPLLLGDRPLGAYTGYDATVDGSVGVLFSTAAYRFGHSMVSDTLLRIDADGEEIAAGHLALRDAFFQPERLATEGGIGPVLRGFAAKTAQELDPKIVDDLRNFLFGPPGAGGLDLAALNIQRGRDHGLPSYNACRVAFGLPAVTRVEEVSSDEEYVARLEAAFDDLEDMDIWVCALCEDRVPGAMVGPLLHRVLREQFRRLRDGDRFWYENVYAGDALREIEQTTLADVIRRNSEVGTELPDRVMTGGDGGRGGRPAPSPLTALQIDALQAGALVR